MSTRCSGSSNVVRDHKRSDEDATTFLPVTPYFGLVASLTRHMDQRCLLRVRGAREVLWQPCEGRGVPRWPRRL